MRCQADITNCSVREELEWCGPAPEPKPVVPECEKELKKSCGSLSGDKCEACVKKLGPTDNCTRREEATFCGGPAPKPGPVEDVCKEKLEAVW